MTSPEDAVAGKAVMAARQHLINEGVTVPIDVVRGALAKAAAASASLQSQEGMDAAEAAWYERDGIDPDPAWQMGARAAWQAAWAARGEYGRGQGIA